jgi:cell division protein FtsQ
VTGDPNAPEFEPVIERDPDLREPEQPDPVEPDAGDASADAGDDDTALESTAEESTAEESTAEEADDPEGPRRRARRERAERREAQQRATAIESARREAKRKALGEVIEAPKRLGDRTVKGLRMLIWLIVLGVASVGLGLVLYFTPVMSARSVVVVGTGAVSREEVVDVAKVAPGTPLLQIDTDAVADRVAGIRRVASARVQREYPSTLRITILERVPVVVKDFGDGPHLFDRDGVDFATAPPPPGLAYIDVDNPGPTDPTTQAALEVMTALRPEVVAQVSRIAAPSVASITLTLTDGRTVVWGTTERTGEKAEKLAALLTQPGRVYDVSSPDLPTVR